MKPQRIGILELNNFLLKKDAILSKFSIKTLSKTFENIAYCENNTFVLFGNGQAVTLIIKHLKPNCFLVSNADNDQHEVVKFETFKSFKAFVKKLFGIDLQSI
jgi:hypothetical protein